MTKPSNNRPLALVVLIVAQSLCAAFFLWDVVTDGLAAAPNLLSEPHFLIEAVAALALISAVVIEVRFLRDLLRRKAYLERQVSVAATAFHEVIDRQFQDWGLTAAEADIAHFMVKGASILDIAGYRGSAEGTIKSHLNAIYRKAGVANRGELLSLLIEDLMGVAPVATDPRASAQTA